MVKPPTSAAQGVFSRQGNLSNKCFKFKELTISFRSILHSKPRTETAQASRPPGGREPEITADSGPRLPGRQDLATPEREGRPIDPLELTLAPVPDPHRAPVRELSSVEPGARSPLKGPALESALVEHVVRRVVWGGDRRRGVARLELDGDFAGTTIWVRGEGRALELEVLLGPGLRSEALPERLLGRLRARGLEVSGLEIR